MSRADATLREMLDVIDTICKYNDEISMYDAMTLRDIGYLLEQLKTMKIKEELLG